MKKLIFIILICVNIVNAQDINLNNNIPTEKPRENIEISPGFIILADFTPIYRVFWKVFDKLDADNKGYLVQSDFRPHLLMWIASWKYFSIIDQNKDGKISREEMKIFSQKEADKQKTKFIEAWKKFDTNKDGLISKKEAKASDFLNSRFNKIDVDKDGYIPPQEVIIAYSQELEGFI